MNGGVLETVLHPLSTPVHQVASCCWQLILKDLYDQPPCTCMHMPYSLSARGVVTHELLLVVALSLHERVWGPNDMSQGDYKHAHSMT